ncbi:nickel-dependent hydrogenase large subunit, partial [Natronobacterium gregoryi]
MVEVTIDPTTRIEGHHGTELEIENGEVVNAKSQMKMFRGAEIITLGRPPYDAPMLTGKVCGVCFTCHRLASSKAVENAAQDAGVFEGPPRNAVLLRNALEGIFYLWNHAIHLYALVGPDYSDAVADTGLDRLDPIEGEGYQAALDQQRKLLKAFAEFGGRAPHPLTYVPGGMAGQPDPSTVESVKSRVAEVSEWIGPTEAAPEVLERYLAADEPGDVEVDPDLGEGLHDLVGLLVAAAQAGTAEHGVGPNRYYSNGVFDHADGDGLFLDRGIYRNGLVESKTRDEIIDAISEDTAYSWYTNDSGGDPAKA